MRPSAAIVLTLLCSACSGARYDPERGPGIVGPVHVAEGSNPKAERVREAPDAEAPVLNPPRGSQPDPAALREARQYEYEVVYDRGKVRVASVHGVRFAKPVVTSRMMGRYAIELWIGHELVERVRFDFPLVAAEDVRHTRARPLEEAPSFAAGVVATVKVLVPASPRATRALLVDRASGASQELPWPPEAPLGSAAAGAVRPPADAGTPDSAAAPVQTELPDAAAD